MYFQYTFKRIFWAISNIANSLKLIQNYTYLHQTHIAPFCWFVQRQRVRFCNYNLHSWPKKLVKSNKSISRKKCFWILHIEIKNLLYIHILVGKYEEYIQWNWIFFHQLRIFKKKKFFTNCDICIARKCGNCTYFLVLKIDAKLRLTYVLLKMHLQ